MNTNPDDELLVRWLDDDLSGAEWHQAETRFAGDPALAALRADSRRWREQVATALPASQEPPHAEFFNARIARAIQAPHENPARPAAAASPQPSVPARFGGRAVWMPLAACAGMVFSFWIGLQQGNRSTPAAGQANQFASTAPRGLPVEPAVYTPVRGVDAEWFESDSAGATVIVLTGVAAIPDSIDLFSSRLPDPDRPSERTASRNEPQPPGNPDWQ